MMCARCDEPIEPGEELPVDNPSPTGAGTTIYVHAVLCKRTLTQTSPAGGPRRA